MKASFIPSHDQLLVERAEYPELLTKGGIILSDHANTNVPCGKVFAAGPGQWQNGVQIPMQWKVGDLVLYRQYAGVERLTVAGARVEVVQSKDILGIYIPGDEEVKPGAVPL